MELTLVLLGLGVLALFMIQRTSKSSGANQREAEIRKASAKRNEEVLNAQTAQKLRRRDLLRRLRERAGN